jgi:hypothetical protein
MDIRSGQGAAGASISMISGEGLDFAGAGRFAPAAGVVSSASTCRWSSGGRLADAFRGPQIADFGEPRAAERMGSRH